SKVGKFVTSTGTTLSKGIGKASFKASSAMKTIAKTAIAVSDKTGLTKQFKNAAKKAGELNTAAKAKIKETKTKLENSKMGKAASSAVKAIKNSKLGRAAAKTANVIGKGATITREFTSGVGTGIADGVKAVGAAVINPINTARAIRDLRKKALKDGKSFVGDAKKNGLKAATNKAANSVVSVIKNSCEGQSKASCLGKTLGGAFTGNAAVAVQKAAEKHAKARGDKDNALQVYFCSSLIPQRFSKGFVGAGADMVSGTLTAAASAVTNPGAATMGLVRTALNPVKSAKAAVDGVKRSLNDCKNDKAKCAGQVAFTAAAAIATAGMSTGAGAGATGLQKVNLISKAGVKSLAKGTTATAKGALLNPKASLKDSRQEQGQGNC
ncbi:MAG: hypothetical protein SGCHY_005008, partial [Lobulomycetales sp.]